MFKKSLFLGITSGILAGIASIIFEQIYLKAFYLDFSTIASPVALMSACIFGCVLAAVGYWALTKWLKQSGEIVFNLLFTILSFASILGPIATTLPLDLDADLTLMFPGFAITMHFFPALAWFTLKPLFFKSR